MKKQQYYKQVLNLFQNDSITRQDIAKSLHISMPTTLQIVSELLEAGILMESGSLESTGGRKAKCLTLNVDAAYTVGINVGLHHVSMVLLNYGGEIVRDFRFQTEFRDQGSWYEELKTKTYNFLASCNVSMEQVLCVGISFPGIIDDEGGWILHSHVFNIHNVSLDLFRKMFPVPVAVFNDANSGGYTELQSYGEDYTYLSLNESVGGAIICDGKLYRGDTFHAGEIGHMILVPDGDPCYCGKKGCADAFLSATKLMDEDHEIQSFMKRVEAGDEEACHRLETYLDWLAIFATNIRMVFNNKLIIGGEIGKIIDRFLPELCKKMEKYDLFSRSIDYIYPCKTKKNMMATGAGRLALNKYRDHILEDME
ncbi:MAG: ROK family transcriptional regulator [Eubacteriales bacterium]|nr:ROK family transcriptional regulator [Eubacteriales bacterium]